VRSQRNGAILHLRDVARTELGAQGLRNGSRSGRLPATAILVYQLPGSNALDVSTGVQKKLDEMAKDFPPGLKYQVTLDTTKFVSESIAEVLITLVEAMVLVLIVVYVFLGNWRATLIPMLAVPVSLVGTFAAFVVLGFSINLLTLFAMILAIGLVIDDAIVVVEAVERHIGGSGAGGSHQKSNGRRLGRGNRDCCRFGFGLYSGSVSRRYYRPAL